MPHIVLVVGDSAFARRVVREPLDRAGYRVIEAVSGHDAIALFPDVRPDIVTMDLAASRISDVECILALRAFDAGARIVAVSASDDDETRELALAAGACAYLRKPFQPSALLDTVRTCVMRPRPRC